MASRTSLNAEGMGSRTKSFGIGTQERSARTVTFLALPDAEAYPAVPLMTVLVCIAFTEGADGITFPSVAKALEQTVGFDILQLGEMATVQLVFQAIAGPLWGMLASRGTLSREKILCIGTFLQGLATLVMWTVIKQFYVVLLLRAINGISLASLRPICNSIVGDRFDDEVRGKMFSFISMGLQLGAAVTGFLGTASAQVLVFGDEQECKYIEGENDPSVFGCMFGWKLTFILVGLFTMALCPAVLMFLKAPPVAVAVPEKTGGSGPNELQKLAALFQKRSFAIIVFQGMFGLLPWRAFEFRTYFFEQVGLPPAAAGALNSVGQASAAAGNLLGGVIGDTLAKFSPNHGRITAAEISVYSGIPIAYFTFQMKPADFGADPTFYFAFMVGILGIMAAWTEPATINPILCALAKEDERALVLSWQTSLQGAIGALGPVMFTVFARSFGFKAECTADPIKEENVEICKGFNAEQIVGTTLFWCSVLPWSFCGALYSTLHCFYPGDVAKVQMENEIRLGNGAQTEMGTML